MQIEIQLQNNKEIIVTGINTPDIAPDGCSHGIKRVIRIDIPETTISLNMFEAKQLIKALKAIV